MLNFGTIEQMKNADDLGIAVRVYDETLESYINRELVEDSYDEQYTDLNEVEEVYNENEEVAAIIVYVASADNSIGGGAFESEADYWRYILG